MEKPQYSKPHIRRRNAGEPNELVMIITETNVTKHSDAHCPFNPSIILKAFITPTIQNIVMGIPKKPNSISPKPKRLPNE